MHMSRMSCICGYVVPVCTRVPRASCMSCGTCAAHVMSCACISLCPCLQLFGSKCADHCAAFPHRFSLVSPLHSSASVAMASSPDTSRTTGTSSSTPSTQSTVLDSSGGSFDEEDLWEALRLPGTEKMEASIASPRLSPARQRQRLDRAGAGRPAPRSLEADLVDAEEAEPDARLENMQPVLPSTQDGEGEANEDAQDVPEMNDFRRVYNKFATNYRRWVMSQTADLNPREQARVRARLALHCKTFAAKVRLARDFWAARGGEAFDMERILAHWREKENGVKSTGWLHARTAFLTYNGDWGKVPSLPVPENLLPGSPAEVTHITELCKKSEHVLELWKAFQAHWDEVSMRDGWTEYVIALELCTTTLREERVVRVHAHASMRKGGSKARVRDPHAYAFRGSLPFLASVVSMARCRTSGDNQCMYYLQCPKWGKVFSKGNIEPFRTYLVSGEWVMNLVQAGKMEVAVAREELIKTAKNLPRLLSNLDKYVMELRDQRLRTRIAEIERELERAERPFKTFPEIERWKEEHALARPRYRFLVLVGPSGLGKTQFAKSLVRKGRSLELNMASAPEPNLKEYDHEQHDLILFDECAAQKVLLQKKLFQAPLSAVSLGQSTTGCFAYSVWVHAKLLVVAFNAWHHDVHELGKADAHWFAPKWEH